MLPNQIDFKNVDPDPRLEEMQIRSTVTNY